MLLSVTRIASGDFDEGLEAFRSGDYAKARSAWSDSAETGDARSQYGMGVLSNEGRGSGIDYALAAMWFRRAARQGLPEAQVELGFMRATGRGVEQDAVQAYVWFALAARAGEPSASTFRDSVKQRLLPDEEEEAQRLLDEHAVELDVR